MQTFHLKDYKDQQKEIYENFTSHVLYSYDKIFPDNLILSAIGARVCYSSDHPLKMITEDKYIIDRQQRIDFLKRLANKGHFSVFAHSPVFAEYTTNILGEILPFKVWMNYKKERNHETYYRIFLNGTVRHLIEYYSLYVSSDLIFDIIDNNYQKDSSTSLKLFIKLSNDEYLYVFEYNIDKNPKNLEEIKQFIEGIDISQSIWIGFYLPFKPFDWFSFIFTGVSRNFSHQLVRHTWQNFNQRSHRYTEVDYMIVPPSIERNKDLFGNFMLVSNVNFELYRELVRNGIKKEDARYVIPCGVNTTIMTSSPRFVFEDFVEKRAIKPVQWEIRRTAYFIHEILSHFS